MFLLGDKNWVLISQKTACIVTAVKPSNPTYKVTIFAITTCEPETATLKQFCFDRKTVCLEDPGFRNNLLFPSPGCKSKPKKVTALYVSTPALSELHDRKSILSKVITHRKKLLCGGKGDIVQEWEN
jgi:hypothetical protein